MNYWDKLEPTDGNVSRLCCFRSESELLPFKKANIKNEVGNILPRLR